MSSNIKYIGLDVHKEAISIAVPNGAGKLVMESIVETKALTLVQFLQGLRGELHVTLEEGTWAAWLYHVLKPRVHEVVVCNPRRNALLKEGSKSDRWMHASWLSCYVPACCDRSTTKNMDCARCAGWGGVIRLSAKICDGC